MVVLGADLDPGASLGLAEGGNEFYSVEAAFAMRDLLPRFERGAAIIGVAGKFFKCPRAPSETAPSEATEASRCRPGIVCC